MADEIQSKLYDDAEAESYFRRLKAAGITDDMPADIDEFRDLIARRLAMMMNNWHGCPEFICRRNRGCMAPNIICANDEVLSAEEEERQWREVQADVALAIKAEVAERGAED